MKKKDAVKLIHEGNYVAEVQVTLIDTGESWTPYLSLEDAYKLDDVKEALRHNDIESAGRLSKVYRLTPVN